MEIKNLTSIILINKTLLPKGYDIIKEKIFGKVLLLSGTKIEMKETVEKLSQYLNAGYYMSDRLSDYADDQVFPYVEERLVENGPDTLIIVGNSKFLGGFESLLIVQVFKLMKAIEVIRTGEALGIRINNGKIIEFKLIVSINE